MHVLICIVLNVSKFHLKCLKKSSAYAIDIYIPFDQIWVAGFKHEVKTGTGSSFLRHLTKNQISGFSKPRISVIRLCSATTRSDDRSVDRRRFGPPSWTRNRTATTPRRTDFDHAECFWDIRADRQTDRRTDTLIAVLRTPIVGEVIVPVYMNENKSKTFW